MTSDEFVVQLREWFEEDIQAIREGREPPSCDGDAANNLIAVLELLDKVPPP